MKNICFQVKIKAQGNFFNQMADMTEEDFKKLSNNEEFIFDEAKIQTLMSRNLERMWGRERARDKKDEIINDKITYEDRCEETFNWI